MMQESANTLARLQRWRDHGGTCTTTATSREGQVLVSLRRCDGGEEVDQLTTDDPEVVAWLASLEDA